MNNSQPIRVMVVDDNAMVRRGLATFLAVFDDLELVDEVASGDAAVQRCAEVLPDVVLMDMVMPGMDGASATHLIRQQFPAIQVLVLTSFKEEELVKSALRAGAIGYLLKDVSADELAQAIRAVHAGRVTLSQEATRTLIDATSRPPAPSQDLTPKER
jgi:two-component system, NarL family, response regulator LiaR